MEKTQPRKMEEIQATKMEDIEPITVTLKSGNHLNVAKIGSGPVVLFLHGFPGGWYSWRHQLVGLSTLRYQAVAPDLRGYGGSSAPDHWSSYSTVHIVGDLVDLLDELKIVDKIFLVGHDWGAIVAWHFCLLRPDRVKAMVNASFPLMFKNPSVSPVAHYQDTYGDGLYICRFQNPEKVNDELSRCTPKHVVRGFYQLFGSSTIPVLTAHEGFDDRFEDPKMPSFLTDEDVQYYADTFQKTGYVGGLNYYKAIEQTWELMTAYEGVQIETPVKFVVGDLDFAYEFDDLKKYTTKGGIKKDVPNVEVVVWSGGGHFLHEEHPAEFSRLICDYFDTFAHKPSA